MAVETTDALVYILGITVTAALIFGIRVYRKLQEGQLLHDYTAVDDTIQDFEIGMAMTALMAFGALTFILHSIIGIESIKQATVVLGIMYNTVLAAVLYRFGRRIE